MVVFCPIDTDLERLECNFARITESCQMLIQILGERSHTPARLTHYRTIRAEEFGQFVQQAELCLQAGLLSDIRFPPLFGAFDLLHFLQHSFTLVNPLHQDSHSAFEVPTTRPLHCLKPRLLLCHLPLPSTTFPLPFDPTA